MIFGPVNRAAGVQQIPAEPTLNKILVKVAMGVGMAFIKDELWTDGSRKLPTKEL